MKNYLSTNSNSKKIRNNFVPMKLLKIDLDDSGGMNTAQRVNQRLGLQSAKAAGQYLSPRQRYQNFGANNQQLFQQLKNGDSSSSNNNQYYQSESQ